MARVPLEPVHDLIAGQCRWKATKQMDVIWLDSKFKNSTSELLGFLVKEVTQALTDLIGEYRAIRAPHEAVADIMMCFHGPIIP